MPVTVGVKIDDKTRDRLKALGALRRRSTHWLMREAVAAYLDTEEAQEAHNLEADAAWESYQRTGKGVTHQDMESWLATWGSAKESAVPKAKPLC